MIKTPTVLVLGAGASQPYEFPTGPGLRQSLLGVSSHLDAIAFGPGHDGKAKAEEFRRTFRRSRDPIDAFLEHNVEWREAGKCLIAAHISSAEQEDNLYPESGDWMTRFFGWMAEDCTAANFETNQLRVITFNYDRSYEFALHEFIKAHFRVSAKEANRVAEPLEVVHVHGSIGELKTDDRRDGRPFKPDLDDLRCVASSIRVISDDANDEILRRAVGMLKEAKRVFCLGFGYHKVNVKRLFGGALPAQTAIYGTCLGCTPADQRVIRSGFPYRMREIDPRADYPEHSQIALAEPTFDCDTFLRHVSDMITR